MSALAQKWNELPRAAKWLGALVVFVGLYFGVIQPLLGLMDRTSARASSLESTLNKARAYSSTDSSDGAVLNSVQSTFGHPLMPGSEKLTREAFTRVVDGILRGNGVEGATMVERPVPMPASESGQLGVGGIERVILEVSFEARQEAVIEVLAALEKAKEVAAISRVRIDKTGMRDEEAQLVRATILPEAWIATSGAGAAYTPSTPRSTNPSESEVIP